MTKLHGTHVLSTSRMVSFEAFHTSQVRQRAREKNEKERHQDQNKATQLVKRQVNELHETASKDEDVPKWSEKLEMHEVQIGIAGLIYLDLVVFTMHYVLFESSSFIDASAQSASSNFDSNNSVVMARLLSSILNFTMFVFILEVALLLYSFGATFFSHYGYSIDLIVISAIIYDDLYDMDLFPMRFLGLLRVWRVARVVVSTINRVEEEHDTTRSKLIRSREDMNRAHLDLKRLESSCKSEIDLRKQVERMLLEYKDEVDMMQEALNIGAKFVAEAANKKMDTIQNTHESKSQNTFLIDPEGDKFYDGGAGGE
jgi:hypothetical protein